MKARNVTLDQMEKALMAVNQKYAGNVEFERCDIKRNGVDFTLRVKSSKAPGHRRGHSGRAMAKACWHVHGDLFDKVLEIAPDAVITSCQSKIDRNGGNWQDVNIGSQVQPLYFSEACDCNA